MYLLRHNGDLGPLAWLWGSNIISSMSKSNRYDNIVLSVWRLSPTWNSIVLWSITNTLGAINMVWCCDNQMLEEDNYTVTPRCCCKKTNQLYVESVLMSDTSTVLKYATVCWIHRTVSCKSWSSDVTLYTQLYSRRECTLTIHSLLESFCHWRY